MILDSPALLITDDDRDFRETLRDVFEPRGFRTLLAADGEEALGIVKREQVHLLLLDMHMPRLDGLETMRRVRETHGQLPCILLSAALDDQIAEKARQLSAYSVLSKPISFSAITSAVKAALQIFYHWPVTPGR